MSEGLEDVAAVGHFLPSAFLAELDLLAGEERQGERSSSSARPLTFKLHEGVLEGERTGVGGRGVGNAGDAHQHMGRHFPHLTSTSVPAGNI